MNPEIASSLFWLACAIVAVVIHRYKWRGAPLQWSWWYMLLVGVCLGPLALFLVVVLPTELKKCPHCNKRTSRYDTVCPHCEKETVCPHCGQWLRRG